MADREKILRYFKAGGDEELAAKLLDLAEGARKSKKFRITDFLDPHSYNVAEIVAANYENIKIEADGGFNNAERVKAAFIDENFMGAPDYGISCFEVKWDKRFYTIGHRDVLGAFMAWAASAKFWAILLLRRKARILLPIKVLPITSKATLRKLAARRLP